MFSVTLRQFHLGGTLPLWGRSGKRWCITVHTFVLGLCCCWLCDSTDIKTVLWIATKSLHYELEKFYFRAYLGQILASCWILGQGQVVPTQKSPKWGSWKTCACWVWCMQKSSRWRKQKGAACYAPVGPGAFSRKCGCHQILAEELMRWLKSW